MSAAHRGRWNLHRHRHIHRIHRHWERFWTGVANWLTDIGAPRQ